MPIFGGGMKRIVYMGTPEYARVILEGLLQSDEFEVVLVITQPDRPVGRHQELVAPPVKLLAKEHNIPIIQPLNLRDNDIANAILSQKPDYIVVAAFGQLLPKKILDIAPCINLHASLLPLYRGASPVQQALLNNDTYTGITAMLMEEGLDSGPVLAYRYVKLSQDILVDELMQRLSFDAAILAVNVLKNYELLNPLGQTKAMSSHCKKIEKHNGEITLDNAQGIYSKYRAFYGWPGIFFSNGLKILEMKLIKESNSHKAGEILGIKDESIVVGCTIGSIEIAMLQPPSKKAMSAKAYIIGRGLRVGDNIV